MGTSRRSSDWRTHTKTSRMKSTKSTQIINYIWQILWRTIAYMPHLSVWKNPLSHSSSYLKKNCKLVRALNDPTLEPLHSQWLQLIHRHTDQLSNLRCRDKPPFPTTSQPVQRVLPDSFVNHYEVMPMLLCVTTHSTHSKRWKSELSTNIQSTQIILMIVLLIGGGGNPIQPTPCSHYI